MFLNILGNFLYNIKRKYIKMIFQIQHISAIDETYRQFTSYAGMSRTNVFTLKDLTKISSQEVQKY